jgi:hypothetical protein
MRQSVALSIIPLVSSCQRQVSLSLSGVGKEIECDSKWQLGRRENLIAAPMMLQIM